jgi:hypothetical protein
MALEINIELAGTTPLLMNRFHDEAQMAASSGTRAATLGEKGTPREQAEKKLYLDADGAICIPQPNLMRCIIDGGAFFKAGRSKVTTQQSSLVPACLDIGGVTLPLISPEPWQVDTRAVRIPSTGGRILCHRPIFHEWAVAFVADLDEDIMTTRLLREIVDAAGKRIGLGDFRPARKGPYGKFSVTRWEVAA